MRGRWVLVFVFTGLLAIQAAAQSESVVPTDKAVPQDRVGQLEQLVTKLQQRIEELEQKSQVNKPAKEESEAPADTGIEALDQKLRILERNRELEQESFVAKAKEAPVVSAGEEGFSISNADKSYRLRIGAQLQVDGKTFYDNRAHLVSNSFVVRRLRPTIEGSVGKYVDFRFMPDFGNGSTLIYDAYADLKYRPFAVLRAGKFKTPLGLEQLQSDADVTFIERSLATDLVPNRDEGFAIYGNIAKRVTYTAAVLNGAPVGQSIDGTTHNGKDVVGRVFATPWATSGQKLLKGLGFGAAASSGRQDQGVALPSFKSTGGQATFFSYLSTSATAGHRLNYSPQLYYYNGPLGLLAEYTVSTQKVSGPGATKGSTLISEITDHAWQVSGSWLLTGESKSFGRLTPRRKFEGGNFGSGFGAWELAARYSALTVDPKVFSLKLADPTKSAEAAREWTVGLNWYLNKNVKVATDFEQTHFQHGAVIGNRPTEKAFEERLQIAF